MVIAWICDFCKRVGTKNEIKDHEDCCVFNLKNKTCYTCKYSIEKGALYSGFYKDCKINLNFEYAKDNGNCKGWEWEKDTMNGKILKI